MDKDELIAGPGETHTTVDLGRGKVTVRGLTRDEAIDVGEAKTTKDRDRKILSWGVVDPELTYQDVQAWQKKPGAAGEIEKVSMEIARLSGMLEGADHQAFPETDPGA